MSDVLTDIVTVDDLLSSPDTEKTSLPDSEKAVLAIPPYQRPYRWQKENVLQLLVDIQSNLNKKQYRVGSVILHDNKREINYKLSRVYDIVDGQQRITTLLLILKALGHGLANSFVYRHNDSKRNIRNNFVYISSWINTHISDRKGLTDFILNKCEFVRLIVTEQSEAFQLFDSQNGRGKELKPYDLLKAYHLRAMHCNTQQERIDCSKRWEKSTSYVPNGATYSIDLLKQVMGEQLYRSRVWMQGNKAKKFTKKKIGEFKGLTIDRYHGAEFPYQNPMLLQFLTENYYNLMLKNIAPLADRFPNGDGEGIYPFTNINQFIVNGLQFFDYVATYVEMYKRLFIELHSSELRDFKIFYYTHCLDYTAKDISSIDWQSRGIASSRSGDGFLREVYKSLIMVLFDKFGTEGLNKYYRILYSLVYLHRIAYSVTYQGAVDIPEQYFKIINQAKGVSDLTELDVALHKKRCQYSKYFTANGLRPKGNDDKWYLDRFGPVNETKHILYDLFGILNQ